MIGFEPHKTVIIERGTGIAQIAGSHQEIENHDGLEHVEFKMTIHSPNSDGGIISNNLSTNHGQRLTLRRVHFTGHDGGSRFVGRDGHLTDPASRA